MKWSARYATGVDQLDKQHQLLFQMSEDFRQVLNVERGERVYEVMLTSLYHYARGHFALENECMLRYRCPVADVNSAAHAEFVHTLAGFRQRHHENGFDRADAERLVDFVDQWLASHVGGIDTQLKPCVENATRG